MIVSTLGYMFTDHKSITFRIDDKVDNQDGTYMFISDSDSYVVGKGVYDYYDEGDTFNMTNNSTAHGVWSTFLFLSLCHILFMIFDSIYDNCRSNNI